MSIYRLILFMSFLWSFAQALGQEPEYHASIGKSLAAKRYKNLYFAGQPSKEDIEALKKQGFAAVINLRTQGEHDEAGERQHASSLGLKYYNHPFPAAKDFDDAYVKAVTESVVKHRQEGKILVHCGSGNRVGIWLGAHFFKDHQYSKVKALEMALKLGIKESGQKVLKQYLDGK